MTLFIIFSSLALLKEVYTAGREVSSSEISHLRKSLYKTCGWIKLRTEFIECMEQQGYKEDLCELFLGPENKPQFIEDDRLKQLLEIYPRTGSGSDSMPFRTILMIIVTLSVIFGGIFYYYYYHLRQTPQDTSNDNDEQQVFESSNFDDEQEDEHDEKVQSDEQ
jgi:hypothetical protein